MMGGASFDQARSPRALQPAPSMPPSTPLSSATFPLRRIERGRARDYWEHNLLDGRLAAERLIMGWFRDPDPSPRIPRRVLDAGCGLARLGERLVRSGEALLCCDVDLSPLCELRRRHQTTEAPLPRLVVADLTSAPFRPQSFDDGIVFELLEHLTGSQRHNALLALERVVAGRLFLTFRAPSRWDRWRNALAPERGPGLPTLDPTILLRELHLTTSFRLRRASEVRRRNCALHCAEFHRDTIAAT